MKNVGDYLHYYLGCEINYATHHEPQNETYTLKASNLNEAIEFGDTPVLRDLKDMTVEEALECIKIVDNGVSQNPSFKILGKDELGEDWVYVEVGYEETECCWRPNPKYLSSELFHYLIERKFDLFGINEAISMQNWAIKNIS